MSKTKLKYLLVPGWVVSKTDGDRHYISAQQLTGLYKVNPYECIVLTENMHGYPSSVLEGLIRLEPRYDGDYTLPPKDDK